MNIAIGKMGRSSRFDKSKWGIFAGDESPYVIYRELAFKFPEHKFYYVGCNDMDRLKDWSFMPTNIIDVYNPGKKLAKIKNIEPYEGIIQYMEDKKIHIDMGIFMQGPDMMSIPNKGICSFTHPDKLIKPLNMAGGISVIVGNLNHFGYPWISINEDARFAPPGTNDIFNDEVVTLSQINDTYQVERIAGYFEKSKEHRKVNLEFKYAGIERMFLADEKKVDYSDPDHIVVGKKVYQKKTPFIMTLNGNPDRFWYTKKWVLDYKPETKVYGEWKHTDLGKFEANFINKGIKDMQDEMWEAMFTYVPVLKKKRLGFVTQKVWRMISYGIIPFWDKNAYDVGNIYSMMPDYFKVETPEEMWQKIDYLSSPEGKADYVKYLNMFYNLLEDKYYNGEYIKEQFKPWIDKYDPALQGK